MRIVVYDIAAQKGGGGETILKQYFDAALNAPQIEWWFFVSIKDYKEYESANIHVELADIRKASKIRSYYLRKKYELFQLKSILKRINPDEIISLQNMVVPGAKCKQTVYLHQSFQFSPVKFRFTKKAERSLAFRQRIICRLIRAKLNKADKVIVQTNWMKKSVSKWAHYPEERIVVEPPKVSLPLKKDLVEAQRNSFIYPANAYLNKNHQIIIDACKILKKQGVTGYRIQFTLSEDSSGLSRQLLKEIKIEGLPIEYIGHLEKPELYEKYQTMITLFPSYIETFGLPLLEAKELNGIVLASDRPFSHEILDGYDKAIFIEWNSPDAWAREIKAQCSYNN